MFIDKTNAFGERVKKQLKNLTHEEVCLFSWLCAVRSLPFLGVRGDFAYWGYDERQSRLASVLIAIDTAVRATADADPYAYGFFSADSVDKDADAAKLAANAAADAAEAAAYAAAFSYDDDSVTHAVDAAVCAANAATYASKYDNTNIDITKILIQDLDSIKAKKNNYQNDVSIYGNIWHNFLNAFRDIGCNYWGNWYATLFTKSLVLDDADKAEIVMRLNIPPEIKKQGVTSVASYINDIKLQGAITAKRQTRLIVLGSAGAGKTTLVRRLNGDMSFPEISDTTHGVDTKFVLDFNGIRACIWDFGGQVMYHSSHRCFMSASCVYILVVNARTGDNRDITLINYWLDTIRIYSDRTAKVFIVLNESDERKLDPEEYSFLKENEYSSLIHEIYSFNVGTDMVHVNMFKQGLEN